MKYIKTLENFKVKSNFGSYYVYPNMFDKCLLYEYYTLSMGDDFDYKQDKKNIKKSKKLKKEIINHLNEYKNLEENENKFGVYPITDFELIFEYKKPDFILKTLKYKDIMGKYEINQELFKDIILYLSDPELYLNTKKYNL